MPAKVPEHVTLTVDIRSLPPESAPRVITDAVHFVATAQLPDQAVEAYGVTADYAYGNAIASALRTLAGRAELSDEGTVPDRIVIEIARTRSDST